MLVTMSIQTEMSFQMLYHCFILFISSSKNKSMWGDTGKKQADRYSLKEINM